MDARRHARKIMLAAVLCMVSLALAAVPALAANPTDPTTTTLPPEETTTTTTLPPEETTTTTTLPPEETTTTTTLPPEETTTTTVPPPPEETTTTTEPPAESVDLTPDETLEPEPAFAYLSNYQRASASTTSGCQRHARHAPLRSRRPRPPARRRQG